jgi:hypothetical protein
LTNKSEESPLSVAQRHVIEAEQRVADLKRILKELLRDRHAVQAEMAGRVLHTLEESLRLARDHLAREQEKTATGSAR